MTAESPTLQALVDLNNGGVNYMNNGDWVQALDCFQRATDMIGFDNDDDEDDELFSSHTSENEYEEDGNLNTDMEEESEMETEDEDDCFHIENSGVVHSISSRSSNDCGAMPQTVAAAAGENETMACSFAHIVPDLAYFLRPLSRQDGSDNNTSIFDSTSGVYLLHRPFVLVQDSIDSQTTFDRAVSNTCLSDTISQQAKNDRARLSAAIFFNWGLALDLRKATTTTSTTSRNSSSATTNTTTTREGNLQSRTSSADHNSSNATTPAAAADMDEDEDSNLNYYQIASGLNDSMNLLSIATTNNLCIAHLHRNEIMDALESMAVLATMIRDVGNILLSQREYDAIVCNLNTLVSKVPLQGRDWPFYANGLCKLWLIQQNKWVLPLSSPQH